MPMHKPVRSNDYRQDYRRDRSVHLQPIVTKNNENKLDDIKKQIMELKSQQVS